MPLLPHKHLLLLLLSFLLLLLLSSLPPSLSASVSTTLPQQPLLLPSLLHSILDPSPLPPSSSSHPSPLLSPRHMDQLLALLKVLYEDNTSQEEDRDKDQAQRDEDDTIPQFDRFMDGGDTAGVGGFPPGDIISRMSVYLMQLLGRLKDMKQEKTRMEDDLRAQVDKAKAEYEKKERELVTRVEGLERELTVLKTMEDEPVKACREFLDKERDYEENKDQCSCSQCENLRVTKEALIGSLQNCRAMAEENELIERIELMKE